MTEESPPVRKKNVGYGEAPYFSPGSLIIDRYEVIEWLGKGMSASVFHCRDYLLSGLSVAVKVFAAGVSEDDIAASRLFRELLTSYDVNHPNVVRMYDTFRTDEMIGIVLEYVNGGTLADIIKDNKLTIKEIRSMLIQLCNGLSAIHKVGVIHRDLKPENILIDSDSVNLKITDFGVAKGCIVEQEGLGLTYVPTFQGNHHLAERKTEHGALVGTLVYVSPEYLMKGIVDFRSDIYALGVIAYELVTGGDLFPNLTDIDFLKAKVGKDPIDPCKIRKDCPRAFSTAILKALHRDPEQRYQTVDEFKFELEHLSADGNQVKKPNLEMEDEVASEDTDLITSILEEFPQLPYFLVAISLIIISISIYFLFRN